MSSRPVVITGAASGIGRATANRFLREGLPAVGIDLQDPPAELAERDDVRWVTGNVADPKTWDAAQQEVTAFGSSPNSLVLSAARPVIGTVLDVTLDDWRSLFDDNVFGATLGLQSLLPSMISDGGGTVVAIISVDSFLAEQGLIAYCASKAALAEIVRCVAMDHARDGIRANGIAPGTVNTPAFQRVMRTASDPEAFLEQRRERNPLGRIIEPDEIASVAYFLSSPDSSGMTGSFVTVDAGLSASFDFRNPDSQGYR